MSVRISVYNACIDARALRTGVEPVLTAKGGKPLDAEVLVRGASSAETKDKVF